MARREPFARHQNVYLYHYHVYIRSTLRVHYITARRSRGCVKPGGRRYFSVVSSRWTMPRRVSFSRWTRLPGYATARRRRACLLANLVIDRIPCAPSTPSHPREPVRSRALLMGRINFVIKSSRIITEQDRGRLDRSAVPRHDEIIKDQLQCALSADRPHRGFARAPTTALYLCWQWFMAKLAYLDCLFIGEISYGPVCHEEVRSPASPISRGSGCCAERR